MCICSACAPQVFSYMFNELAATLKAHEDKMYIDVTLRGAMMA